MSCYDWERGTIQIPKKVIVSFRKKIINEYNSNINRLTKKTKAGIQKASDNLKGKRGLSETHWRDQLISFIFPISKYEDDYDIIEANILQFKKNTGKPSIRPKNQLPFIKLSTQNVRILTNSFVLDINTLESTVYWHVFENNHAVRDARNSFIGNVLFDELDKIKWVRQTGGCIYGSDEYALEAAKEGGYSPIRSNNSYGPLGRDDRY